MFQIVALIFVVSNGNPSMEPDSTVRHGHQFPTLEACQDFLASPEGAKATGMISEMTEFKDGSAIVKFQCQPSEPGK